MYEFNDHVPYCQLRAPFIVIWSLVICRNALLLVSVHFLSEYLKNYMVIAKNSGHLVGFQPWGNVTVFCIVRKVDNSYDLIRFHLNKNLWFLKGSIAQTPYHNLRVPNPVTGDSASCWVQLQLWSAVQLQTQLNQLKPWLLLYGTAKRGGIKQVD